MFITKNLLGLSVCSLFVCLFFLCSVLLCFYRTMLSTNRDDLISCFICNDSISFTSLIAWVKTLNTMFILISDRQELIHASNSSERIAISSCNLKPNSANMSVLVTPSRGSAASMSSCLSIFVLYNIFCILFIELKFMYILINSEFRLFFCFINSLTNLWFKLQV